MATMSLFCASLNHLSALILVAKNVVTTQADFAILNVAFDSVLITLVAFLGLLRAAHMTNALLFDVPLHKEFAPWQFTRAKDL